MTTTSNESAQQDLVHDGEASHTVGSQEKEGEVLKGAQEEVQEEERRRLEGEEEEEEEKRRAEAQGAPEKEMEGGADQHDPVHVAEDQEKDERRVELESQQIMTMEHLTEEQVHAFAAAFDTFDKHRTGRIEIRELDALLRSLGENPEGAQTDAALDRAGLSEARGSAGHINRTEFLKFMAQRHAAPEPATTVKATSKKPVTLRRRCAYAGYHVLLFFAHWFGPAAFDFDRDSDVNVDDAERQLDKGWSQVWQEVLDGEFKADGHGAELFAAKKLQSDKELLAGPAAAGAKPAKKVGAKPRPKTLSLESIKGRWLVGNPGSDFVATILEGGRCLYDGRHMGPENDLLEGGTEGAPVIKRPDGWSINMAQSSAQLLLWSYPDQPPLEWRRVPESALDLQGLQGEWRVFEDGVESTDVVTLEADGRTFYDGEPVPDEDVTMTTASGTHEISRKDGYIVDLTRSSNDVLVWSKAGEQTNLVWRRPQGARSSDLASDALNLAEDVLEQDVQGEAVEDHEVAAAQGMLKGRTFPYFIVTQSAVATLLWFGFSMKQCTDKGQWGSVFTNTAGFDTLFSGRTSLQLIDIECNSFRFQLWRWWTYQFTHVGANHVLLNCILTLILGFPLEVLVRSLRMAVMFHCGVIGGALFYGIWDATDVVVGMSGGCYSLIGIHVAEIAMNWNRMRFRNARIMFLLFLVAMEVVNTYVGGVKDSNDKRPSASNSTHFGGFITGLVMGTMVGYNLAMTRKDQILKIVFVSGGLVLLFFCMVWIFAHHEPYPIWEWGRHPTFYMYRQVYNRVCFGNAWRCVRCACDDAPCRGHLGDIATVGRTSWYASPVDYLQCPLPWYAYSSKPPGSEIASLEFASIPFDDAGSPCFTSFR